MISNLLIFFAIPLAVVFISIALQKVLRNPFLVASIIFSILLVIVLAFFDAIYLIAVVAYTILSFITALISCLLCRLIRNQICNIICNNNEENDDNEMITISNSENSGMDGTTYSCGAQGTYNTNNFSGTTGSYARKYNLRR